MRTKRKTIKLLAVFALVISVTLSSCSSSDSDVAAGENLSEVVMQDFVKDLQALSVPSGLSNSNNQYAQQANAQFQTMKTLGSSFAALFVVPANAVSAKSSVKTAAKSSNLNTKTYTWAANGVSITYSITEASDRYTFEYSIVSSDFTGKYMDGYQLKDGSYAEARLYAGSNQVVSTIKWWVAANTTKIELDADGYKIIMESNTDKTERNPEEEIQREFHILLDLPKEFFATYH